MLWLLPIFLIVHLAWLSTVYLLSRDTGVPNRRMVREQQLIQAIEQGETGKVRRLIDAGVNPNARGESGDPAVHIAIAQTEANRGLVEFLLASGAKIDAENNYQQTPLHYACAHGQLSIVNTLIKHGADVNYKDDGGETPLFDSIDGFDNHFPVVLQELVAHGADPQARSESGETLLFKAAWHDNSPATAALLRLGLDSNARDVWGRTPLMEAAITGSLDCMKLLLAHGANVKLADEDGMTALHFAINRREPPVIEALLAAGAPVNARDNNGQTPYGRAIENEDPEIARLLREHGGRK